MCFKYYMALIDLPIVFSAQNSSRLQLFHLTDTSKQFSIFSLENTYQKIKKKPLKKPVTNQPKKVLSTILLLNTVILFLGLYHKKTILKMRKLTCRNMQVQPTSKPTSKNMKLLTEHPQNGGGNQIIRSIHFGLQIQNKMWSQINMKEYDKTLNRYNTKMLL